MDNLVIKYLLEQTTLNCLQRYNYDFDYGFNVIVPYLKENIYAIEFTNGARIVIAKFNISITLNYSTLDLSEISFYHDLMDDISMLDIF